MKTAAQWPVATAARLRPSRRQVYRAGKGDSGRQPVAIESKPKVAASKQHRYWTSPTILASECRLRVADAEFSTLPQLRLQLWPSAMSPRAFRHGAMPTGASGGLPLRHGDPTTWSWSSLRRQGPRARHPHAAASKWPSSSARGAVLEAWRRFLLGSCRITLAVIGGVIFLVGVSDGVGQDCEDVSRR